MRLKIYDIISVKEFTVHPKISNEESIQEIECSYSIGWFGEVQVDTLYRFKYKYPYPDCNRTFCGLFFSDSVGNLEDTNRSDTEVKINTHLINLKERTYIEI